MPIAHTRNANALCYFPCIARDASKIQTLWSRQVQYQRAAEQCVGGTETGRVLKQRNIDSATRPLSWIMLGISNRIGVNIKLETQYLFLGSKLPSLVTKWSYKLKAAIVHSTVCSGNYLFSILGLCTVGSIFSSGPCLWSAADRSEV